ncbi:MAG: DUF402 domain-containing protein, partial [Acholeplasmataceae bacterium]|nr:DUF402 domain-containing protein [Acholeplasmataceae bacterium]
MKQLKIGSRLPIFAYKHNGELHRMWMSSIILKKQKNLIILGNLRTKVIEASGKNWMTKEPSITFFSSKYFFNIIAMIRKEGIYFYCNLSSPSVIDSEGLKYIDYDIDVRVLPDFSYQILDQNEYEYHKQILNYSDDIDKVINEHFKILINK